MNDLIFLSVIVFSRRKFPCPGSPKMLSTLSSAENKNLDLCIVELLIQSGGDIVEATINTGLNTSIGLLDRRFKIFRETLTAMAMDLSSIFRKQRIKDLYSICSLEVRSRRVPWHASY